MSQLFGYLAKEYALVHPKDVGRRKDGCKDAECKHCRPQRIHLCCCSLQYAIKQYPFSHKAACRRYPNDSKCTYHCNHCRIGHLARKSTELRHAPCAGLKDDRAGHHEKDSLAKAVSYIHHCSAGDPEYTFRPKTK